MAAAAQKRNLRVTDPPQINAPIEDGAEIDARGLIKSALVPTCFMWIHRSVFERMLENEELQSRGLVRRFIYEGLPDAAQKWCATYFGYGLAKARDLHPEHRIAERLGIDDPSVDTGEDFDFAIKCEIAGIPLYLDAEIELVHYDGRVAHDWSVKKMVVDAHSR